MTLDLDTFVRRVRSGESLVGMDLRDGDPFIMSLGDLDLRTADLSRDQQPWSVQAERLSRLGAEGRAPCTRAGCGVEARPDPGGERRLPGGEAGRGIDDRGRSAEAEFTMADLSGAHLTGSDLTGVRPDRDTRWPDGAPPD